MKKNPTSTFKIGGIFAEKMFRKYLETFVIISLQGGDSRYFSKKCQKLFKVDENPTSSFKIGGKDEKKRKKKKEKMKKKKRERERKRQRERREREKKQKEREKKKK